MTALTDPPPRVSVILPAYNEGHHLYANLQMICGALHGYALEVIVVDDGSRDSTFAESARASADGYPIRTVRLAVNLGKGAALFKGFACASGDYVAFLDSDLEIAPDNVIRLMETMQATGADVVVGVKADGRSEFPLPRRILSRTYQGLVALLFGLSLHDTQTGIKLFKREVLEQSIPRLTVSRFAFDIELLVAAARFGYQIAEYPVQTTYNRNGSLGRMRTRHMAGMLLDTFTIYYRASFWRWLQPGWSTQFWMIAFAVGLLLLGIGIGKLVTPLVLQPPLSNVVYILAFQFLPRALRDWLVVIGGAVLMSLSLIQLNKSLLAAFARRDHGDLAGIFTRKD